MIGTNRQATEATMRQQITASVTKDAVEDLDLQTGAKVVAVIKSTEVMVGVE
jgi:molybdopterin-binding protein